MVEQVYNAFLSCDQKITTDTRNIAKNDLFFALKGPNFNGNKYAEKALELGSKYAVIDEKKYFIEGKTFLNYGGTVGFDANIHRSHFYCWFDAETNGWLRKSDHWWLFVGGS